MNPFLVSADKRLRLWKEFRETLTQQDHFDQLESVAQWFAETPTVNFSIDYDTPSSWPSPWELIEEGNLCESGIAYLMERTLALSGWDSSRLQLILLKNTEAQILRLCLLVDGLYILNYSYLAVMDWKTICNDCIVQAKFEYDGHKHIKI